MTSSFVSLENCDSSDGTKTVRTLPKCFSLCGVSLYWDSDQGSHFKNNVMMSLSHILHAHHDFTATYILLNRTVLSRLCVRMYSELHMHFSPSFESMKQSGERLLKLYRTFSITLSDLLLETTNLLQRSLVAKEIIRCEFLCHEW